MDLHDENAVDRHINGNGQNVNGCNLRGVDAPGAADGSDIDTPPATGRDSGCVGITVVPSRGNGSERKGIFMNYSFLNVGWQGWV